MGDEEGWLLVIEVVTDEEMKVTLKVVKRVKAHQKRVK
jgi:hypothetical protein